MTTIQINPELKSEIEKYQNIVKVRDIIEYSDNCNYMRYEVTDLFDGGMEVKAMNENCNVEIGKFEDYYFNELQKGWKFSEETKNLKKEFYEN